MAASNHDDRTRTGKGTMGAGLPPAPLCPGLMLAWSSREPHRVGEVILFTDPYAQYLLGRKRSDSTALISALPIQQRPGALTSTPRDPFTGETVSAKQALLGVAGNTTLTFECVGKAVMKVNGDVRQRGLLKQGDLLSIGDDLLLLVVTRPSIMESLPSGSDLPPFAFGQADVGGMVGESPVVWQLRATLVVVARQIAPVLVLGESGTGKELAAWFLHHVSPRHDRDMISLNAASPPEGLIEAELFGNRKDYPHMGAPERKGYIGEADRSTLFLDEIGALSQDLQTRLMRVMSRPYTYQRLGESNQSRVATCRFLGATNRRPEDLKHDLAARFTLRIVLPRMEDRREDIPLLVRSVLRRIAREDAAIARRFFTGGTCEGEPRLSRQWMTELLRQSYPCNLRDLERTLRHMVIQALTYPPSLEERLGVVVAPIEVDEATRLRNLRSTLLSNDVIDLLEGLARQEWNTTKYSESPGALYTSRTQVNWHRDTAFAMAIQAGGGEEELAAAILMGRPVDKAWPTDHLSQLRKKLAEYVARMTSKGKVGVGEGGETE